MPAEERYIRYYGEFDPQQMISDDDDDEDAESFLLANGNEPFRIAICMSREGSRRLQDCQYVQSDIAFKRVVGFQEFELGALERHSESRTSAFLTNFSNIFSVLISSRIRHSILPDLRDLPDCRGPPLHLWKDRRDSQA